MWVQREVRSYLLARQHVSIDLSLIQVVEVYTCSVNRYTVCTSNLPNAWVPDGEAVCLRIGGVDYLSVCDGEAKADRLVVFMQWTR